jgi:hypothetical protein
MVQTMLVFIPVVLLPPPALAALVVPTAGYPMRYPAVAVTC